MSGGQFKINGIRLYDTILINIVGDPYFIFKYDQLMHLLAYFAISILVYYTLKKHMKKQFTKTTGRWKNDGTTTI